MTKDQNSVPVLLNESSWFDESDGTVSFTITENVTLTLFVEEFLDFLEGIEDIRSLLIDQDCIVVGTATDKDGNQTDQLLIKPKEDEYH